MTNVFAAMLIGVLFILWRIVQLLDRISTQLKNYHIQAHERHENGKANFWAGVERLEKTAQRSR